MDLMYPGTGEGPYRRCRQMARGRVPPLSGTGKETYRRCRELSRDRSAVVGKWKGIVPPFPVRNSDAETGDIMGENRQKIAKKGWNFKFETK